MHRRAFAAHSPNETHVTAALTVAPPQSTRRTHRSLSPRRPMQPEPRYIGPSTDRPIPTILSPAQTPGHGHLPATARRTSLDRTAPFPSHQNRETFTACGHRNGTGTQRARTPHSAQEPVAPPPAPHTEGRSAGQRSGGRSGSEGATRNKRILVGLSTRTGH